MAAKGLRDTCAPVVRAKAHKIKLGGLRATAGAEDSGRGWGDSVFKGWRPKVCTCEEARVKFPLKHV